MSGDGGSTGAELGSRLLHVEELVAFAQHDVDGLRSHAAEIDRLVESLVRRVEILERRLAEAQRASASRSATGGGPEAGSIDHTGDRGSTV